MTVCPLFHHRERVEVSPRCNHNNNNEYHSNNATINGEKNGAPVAKDLEARINWTR